MDIPNQVVLWCPIPSAIHPAWQSWERSAIEWMERFGLEGEQRESGRLYRISVGELVGRILPNCSYEAGARFSAQTSIWLFAFDDAYCDEGRLSHDPGEMALLVGDLSRIAETGRTTSAAPIARGLADLRRQLDELAGPAATARWVQSMKIYLGYQVWEAAHRSRRSMPSIDQYVVARIRSGAVELSTMALPISEGYDVPGDEMESPEMRALTEITCTITGLDNDIASYYKEHSRSGDTLNLIDVIAHERGVTQREALTEALDLRDAVLSLYLQLSDQVRAHASASAHRYLDGLSRWIRGNLDWSMHTGRYRRDGVSTISVTERPRRELPSNVIPPDGVAWWWSCLGARRAAPVPALPYPAGQLPGTAASAPAASAPAAA
jgi:hypothetical protein